ncbi:hypothetical protein BCR43DRAFT_471139 [Syncephalastrum racemosum]|uniref:Uncharacterized protein n=1 Tax=Syncephalastrum racemosum TaxID=13706 RepID=A0A1X2HI68_SYNRA|nr:hypothetical protein BCR43DRAFT_471139 [Syncephalastrum racemosum]
MASRFSAATRFVRAPLSRSVARRGYASESASKHAGQEFPEESFGNNVWRNATLLAIAGVVWYRVDQHLTGQGDDKHPFTKWIEYHMTPSSENDRFNQATLEEAEKLAEYRLIAQDAQRAPIYRMRYPESFERASPRGLQVGLQCDLSDLKVRTD